MTLFLDVNAISKLVHKVGNAEFINGLLRYMERDFIRWDDFDKCPRTAAHSSLGVIEIMPIADKDLYAFKYVNGHPSNPILGLSTVMAFGAISDVATGYPKLLSELTLLTAFRTAVTSAMAAKALANPNSRIMGMIGCGAQSEFQAIAFHVLMGIKELRIFDIDKKSMDKVARHLALFPDLNVIQSSSAKECVLNVDIVTTVTADKSKATILTPDMITAGMHINGVGGDCPGKTELHADVLKAGKVFVEYEPQTRVEGDIQQLDPNHPVYPLWSVISGSAIGREHEQQITIFDSVGFALEDLSTLRYVYDLAIKHRIGEHIDLVPQLDDPKDVFSLLHTPTSMLAVKKIA